MNFSHRSKVLANLAALIFAGVPHCAFASDNALFNQGVQLLNNKHYVDSVACLVRFSVENPKNALAHCYLGLALVHVGKLDQARQEFFASYCLDPDGATGKYANAALSAFQPEARANKTVEAKPLERDENYKKTLSVIHEQAQREKGRKNSSAEAMASGAAASAEAQVSKIQNSSAQSLGMTPYVGTADGQSRYQSNAQPGTPLAQAEESMRIARLAAQDKSADYRLRSKADEKKIEDVARNLESQLKESHLPGQAVLKPQGTGFYVRYYGPTDPHNAVPEVHPGVVRILDPNSSSYQTEELAQEQNKSAGAIKSVKAEVSKQ